MRYESLLAVDEKNKWLDLEVTLGTNDTLIDQEVLKLHRFLKNFTESEKLLLDNYIGLLLNLNSPLNLNNNPKLLKLLLIKKFIYQHGLTVIREAISSPGVSEKVIFLEITDALFNRNEYPEKIYVYSVYRQRGTPTTWLKVIENLTGDEIEQKLENKIKSLQSYINFHLKVSRRFRLKQKIGNLTIFLFTKTTGAKVIKAEIKNLEAQVSTYTIIIFDRSENKLGVVTGSKREIQFIQKYIRYKLLPDSIGALRTEFEIDKKILLQKLVASNPDQGILLNSVFFKTTQLPNQPILKLKAADASSLDDALNTIPNIWNDLGIEALRSVDYQFQNKIVNVYVFGDDWKRIYINVSAKGKSDLIESHILNDINERLGMNIKEARFIVESLTDEYILEKLLKDKKASTFPPVPKQVEKLTVRLIKGKIIRKPTKVSKRKCMNCYSFSWDKWECPRCDRESMILVGETINIDIIESTIVSKLASCLQTDLSNHQVMLIPYKQRKNYKKSVIRIYNSQKNLSVFMVLISNKKDLPFVEDLLHEGFGVVAIIDPDMSEKTDHLEGIGCDLIKLPAVINKIINGGNEITFSDYILNQEVRVLERIFSNLRISLDNLSNKPIGYNEDTFEIDIKNLFQAIIPDVIRLGTEYKGRSVPDGYCCYGYRNSPQRKKRRILGWDAKFSITSSYSLSTNDLNKQKKYLEWLTLKNNEPNKMGSLGIYAFISNFSSPNGFKTTLQNLTSWSDYPSKCKLVLIQDELLVKICQWLLDHWQQVINNNSLSAEEIFKFIRKNRGSKPFNILTISHWQSLENKLDQTI